MKVTYADGQTAIFHANQFRKPKKNRRSRFALRPGQQHPYWPEWTWDGRWFVKTR